tara:strand:+ start:608 stop:1831 length:1224 start_codon:yes stop_codon:yes gene_type:complete
MSDLNTIKLHDRIKETSSTAGTSNMVLDGAVAGFDPFHKHVGQSGLVYYAITDGTNYEVGSGRFLDSGRDIGTFSTSQLTRSPLQSSNDNGLVDWAAGLKEVYVTYPSSGSVFKQPGVNGGRQPAQSGISFWNSDSALSYSSDIIWDDTNSKVGIRTNAPAHAIDIGGDATYSHVRSSGLILGGSGIVFSGVNVVRQVDAFKKNQADVTSGARAVIQYSGEVNEQLTFMKQSANNFLSGPSTGAETYPSFRAITDSDLPDLQGTYVLHSSGTSYKTQHGILSGIVYAASGYLANDIASASGYAKASAFAVATEVNSTSKPAKYNFHADATRTQNTVISESGWLRLPIFESTSDLPVAISGHQGTVAICKIGDPDMFTLVFCVPSGSTTPGTYAWYKPANASAGYIPV